MAEFSSKNDPSAEWPEEIKQAYRHLKIPSLYDAVLANEKLSLEIRRQDRDLKTILTEVQQLSTQFNALIKIVEEEWEEYEEEEEESILQGHQNGFKETAQKELTDLEVELLQETQNYQEKQVQSILMETHDNLRDLANMVRQMTHQLLALLPKKEGIIPHPPTWHPIAEEILQTMVQGIERSRYQLLSRLEELQIEIVDPQPGEVFNQSLHHALDHISGGESGTIAHVVRVGYKQRQQMLRLADVTIYN